MNPFSKSSSTVKGHNILDSHPMKKTTINLKNTFRLVKSYVSFYHCAWLLMIILFQFSILLVLLTTRGGPSPPPTHEQYPPTHLQQEQPQQPQVIQQLDLPLDDDKIQQEQVAVQEQQQPKQQPLEEVVEDGNKPKDDVSHQLGSPADHEDGDNNTKQVPLEQAIEGHQLASPFDQDDNHEQCKYGKVYAYDLPPIFNKELVINCHDLDPWKSKCPAVSNNGFGPNAAATLVGTVPQKLAPSWWWTDMFSGEIIYHTRMSHYKCRTMEPESATAFYVPFYAGLAVSKYLFTNYTASERDYPCERFLEWVKEQPYWKRSNGSDHFLVLGRMTWDFRRKTDDDWGTRFLLTPLMKNMLRLTVERHRWDPLEISYPYPTGFHPRSAPEIEQWQQFAGSRNRTSLFTFVGAKRQKVKNDFRTLLLDHCRSEADACNLVDCDKTPCSDGSSAILEALLHSDFCLQPRGDTDTRKSTFDCMLSGSIPVFFWEGSFRGQHEMFLSGEPESYSVFIDRKEVRNGTSVRRVLEGISEEDIKRMRDKVIELIPRLVYAFPSEGLGNDAKDAFDITVEGVLQKVVQQTKRHGGTVY
ncbi:unnamed protein product [Coffea canephora]|uniref:Exostosin GT47 domain-containing protein n=1 Tax=Coffea canephora TaxID=49390 RepID=A0A068U311_COFCA|nr:unnamed protein product [Coffea canephora]